MADNIEHQDKGELVANCDRFYSHRLKASCATNGFFYKLYAPLQANCPQLADNFRQYRRIVFTSGYSIQIHL